MPWQASRLPAGLKHRVALASQSRIWRRRTWLLSGIPRSGSSLCCRLAGELPDTVALTEPIQDVRSGAATAAAACRRIEAFARDARARILAQGRAPTLHRDGRLVDNLVSGAATQGLRRPGSERGDIDIDAPVSRRFTLLIKHNALFAALLPRLGEALPCLAIVRNPLAVLASWQTVDLAVRRGRVPMGERFDERLAARLDGEPETLKRQLLVLNWFFERYGAHLPPERILRYEDVIESRGMVLHRALGVAGVAAGPLSSRNANALYDREAVDGLLAALLHMRGAWTRFYSEQDCAEAAAAIRAAGQPSVTAGGNQAP